MKTGLPTITCPFCSLLCDDLIFDSAANSPRIVNSCPRSQELYLRLSAQSNTSATASAAASTAAGGSVRSSDAIKVAAKLLHKARMPLITGLATDVAGQRTAYSLANELSAIVDHGNSDLMMRDLQVMQFRGGYYGTLSEIKSRAEEIVIVGAGPLRQMPRLLSKLNTEQPPGFSQVSSGHTAHSLDCDKSDKTDDSAPITRKLTFILPWHLSPLNPNSILIDSEIAPGSGDGRDREVHTVPDLISWAKAFSSQCRTNAESTSSDQVGTLVQRLRSAKYSAIIWSSDDFHDVDADLAIDCIMEGIVELNSTTRAVGMASGGSQAEPTSAAVMTWLSGFPCRFESITNPGTGQENRYDPHRCDGPRLIQQGLVDIGVWISTLDPDFGPPESSDDSPVRWIGIGPEGASWKGRAEIFIPVGVPGLDHAGILFRNDQALSVAIEAIRESHFPSAATVLRQLREQIQYLNNPQQIILHAMTEEG